MKLITFEYSVMNLIKYFKEIEYMKYYILAAFIPVIFVYSIFFFLDGDSIIFLTDEDQMFEWVTVLFFLGASFICLRLFIRTKNVFFILFFLAFFFAGGEEVSWGQRILGFEAPEAIKVKNVQQEFTLHNLEFFNTVDHIGQPKEGVIRLLEINFLFRLGTIGYGILLPLLVFSSGFVKKITRLLKMPVPPVTIGIFFLINWLIFRIIHTSLDSYPGGGDEIFECMGAYILFLISVFYFIEINKVNFKGSDLKEAFVTYSYTKKLPSFQR